MLHSVDVDSLGNPYKIVIRKFRGFAVAGVMEPLAVYDIVAILFSS